MRLAQVMVSFWDELEKISTVSLSGLSPETVLNSPQPEPMVTTGLDKARSILQKAEQIKTAGKKRHATPLMDGVKLPTVSGEEPKKNIWDNTKSVAGHGLAGAAAGKTLAELASKNVTNLGKWRGAVAGSAVGLGDYAYQKLRQKKAKEKKASLASPGMALKASQQVGKATRARGMTTSIKSVTPKIGLRGSLP